ncbi:MAG: MoaD/ThiS family protein [Candidatus Bathyarchaeia archaeon]
MAINVKLIGALRHISGKKELSIAYVEGISVKELVDKMGEQVPQLKQTFCDQTLNSAQANSLVLVNGREISILNGYQTKLVEGDEVVFVPVVHGG